MLHFLEADIREQKKYEMRTQTSVDNTVNDLRYKIKFKNCGKDKNNFLLSKTLLFFLEQRYILFSETILETDSQEFNYLSILLPRQILKK